MRKLPFTNFFVVLAFIIVGVSVTLKAESELSRLAKVNQENVWHE